jgi:hypothetical protein
MNADDANRSVREERSFTAKTNKKLWELHLAWTFAVAG